MIRVDQVTRRFGTLEAVRGVSFEIGAGEVVGFLGPNGAGKSTLLKMLSTFLLPSTGSIEVAGYDTRRDSIEVRRRIGYLPEHNALFDNMRVRAFLRFMGAARGLEDQAIEQRIEELCERVQLETVLGKRLVECSKGYRQRIGLAAALIHDPPVLLLDEPTHGLDPLQVVAFRKFLAELREGRAILFSSHILAEVAQIATRLLVIQDGQICLDAPLAELNARAGESGQTLEQLVIQAVSTGGAGASQ